MSTDDLTTAADATSEARAALETLQETEFWLQLPPALRQDLCRAHAGLGRVERAAGALL